MSDIIKTPVKEKFSFSVKELKFLKDIIGKNIPFNSIIETKSFPKIKVAKVIKDSFNIDSIAQPEDLSEVAYKLIENKNIVSKDKTIKAKIEELKDTEKAIVISSALNSTFLKVDSTLASQIAVSEAYKKIVCSGAKPIALYSNIDLTKKDLALAGIKEACEKLNIVFTEDTTKIDKDLPYSTIGMIGVISDKTKIITPDLKEKGNMIFLIGESKEDISSSEYLSDFHGVKKSPIPNFNLDEDIKINNIVKQIVTDGLVQSASVISKGGLFFSLLESAMPNNFGFDITTDAEVREDSYLFGEAQERAIVTVADALEEDFIDFMIANNYNFSTIGHVTKGDIRVDDESYGNIKDIKEIYEYILTK